MTLIYPLKVEQNAALALRLADRGYVMESGKIVLGANRNELLDDERIKKRTWMGRYSLTSFLIFFSLKGVSGWVGIHLPLFGSFSPWHAHRGLW